MLGKQRLTRRRIIVLGGTTLTLGAAGLSMASQEASAAVTGEFSVADATFTPEDNQLTALYATASGQWEFSGLETAASEWRVYLLVDAPDNPGDWAAIGMTSGSTSGTEAADSYALRGEVTAASHYDASTFDVSDGQPVEVSIPTSVLFMALSDGGDTLAKAEAVDTVTVTVEPGGSVSAIGGTGELHMVDDAGDPTPTVPGDA